MKKWAIFAFMSMVLNGIVIIFQKYVSFLKMDAYIDVYLGISYLIGFAMCLSVIIARKYAVKVPDLSYGLAGGILSYTGSYLYIMLMGVFPSTLLVPLFSCGSIILVTLCSVTLYKERLGKRQILALLTGLAAVTALCI